MKAKPAKRAYNKRKKRQYNRKQATNTLLKGIKVLTEKEMKDVRLRYGKTKPSTRRIMDRYIAKLQVGKGGVLIEKRGWEQTGKPREFAAKAFPEWKLRSITVDTGWYIFRTI